MVFFAVLIPLQTAAQGSEIFRTEIFRQQGIASWYGSEFDGRPTASGEIFDSSQLTAAHPTLPFNTMLVVINQHNNRSVIVRVNDRGPFVSARIIDISRAAAEQLDMLVTGTAPVIVQSIEHIVVPASPSGTQADTQTALLTTFVDTINIPAESAVPVHGATGSTTVFPAQPQSASPSAAAQASSSAVRRLIITPETTIVPSKSYRLQVGSYTNARYAVDAFERLKDAGLNPAYERYISAANTEYYRVVIAGIRGTDVQAVSDRILSAGFFEALIREEN